MKVTSSCIVVDVCTKCINEIMPDPPTTLQTKHTVIDQLFCTSLAQFHIIMQGCSKLFEGGVARVYIPHVVSMGGLGACSPRKILLN